MRKSILLFSWCLVCGISLPAQNDTLESGSAGHIAGCRLQLKAAFLNQDTAAGHFWLDSLQRFDSPELSTTLWDERWMFYYWLDDYERLLAEVEMHNLTIRELEAANYVSPDDSLFQLLDGWLYEHREEKFGDIRGKIASEEDRAFAALHLEYLLRLSTAGDARQDLDRRLEAFVGQYPKSRFRIFGRLFMYRGEPAVNFAVDIDLGYVQGNWTDQIERTMRTLNAFHVGAGFWKKRFNVQGVLTAGGMKLDRPLLSNLGTWPMGDQAAYLDFSLELGYDLVNRDKIRIFPSLGGGFSWLQPATPEEGDDPLPVYYDYFYFNSPSLSAAVTTDLKFRFLEEDNPENINSYFGIRLRVGYRRLFFGNDHEALAGNMIFFATAFNFYGAQTSTRRL